MVGFWISTLIGLGIGLVVFPIGLGIYIYFRNVVERRRAKRLINAGKFLKPIDAKDFDSEAWKNHVTVNPADIEGLNKKLFTKTIDNADMNFYNKVADYVIDKRALGWTDKQILEEFKIKGYTSELIERLCELNEIQGYIHENK